MKRWVKQLIYLTLAAALIYSVYKIGGMAFNTSSIGVPVGEAPSGFSSVKPPRTGEEFKPQVAPQKSVHVGRHILKGTEEPHVEASATNVQQSLVQSPSSANKVELPRGIRTMGIEVSDAAPVRYPRIGYVSNAPFKSSNACDSTPGCILEDGVPTLYRPLNALGPYYGKYSTCPGKVCSTNYYNAAW